MLSCHTIDWKQVREKIGRCDWAKACFQQIHADFHQMIQECPPTPPLEPSAWAHHYYCPECAARLTFSFQEPHHHYCTFCHKEVSGGVYDGAWRKAVHGSIVSNMERAAVLANLEEDSSVYTEYIHRLILFYADHYLEYEVHGKHAGLGRVMPQSLTEAIFLIALEQILRMVSGLNLFTEQEWAHIQKDLFAPAAELIRPQIDKIHNIHAWMASSLCACASVLEDEEMLQEALFGKLGWKEQLEKGVNEDGLWYEESSGYHFYAMYALMAGARIAREHGIPAGQDPRLLQMGTSIYQIAYPNSVLPAYNDCGFTVFLSEYAPLFEEVSSWRDSADDENLLCFCYGHAQEHGCTPLNVLVDYMKMPSNGYARNSIAALLYGKPELHGTSVVPSGSVLLPHSGIAVLRQDSLRVGLKFSPDGGGHDHCDKLSMELGYGAERLCADTGTSGYTAELTNEWCRTPLAHNMVVIDEGRQQHCDARLLAFTPERVEAETDSAYPGILLKRRMELIPQGFEDTFSVQAEEPRCIDYVIRCTGKAECSLLLEPTEAFTGKNGYNQLMHLKKARTDGAFTAAWQSGKLRVEWTVRAAPDTEVFLADCFGVDRTQEQMILIVRRHTSRTVFQSTCRVLSASGAPAIS